MQEDSAAVTEAEMLRQKQEDRLWSFIKKDGSLEAYEEYKALYPDGRYLREVEKLIARALEKLTSSDEASAWAIAQKTNSISAYAAFVDIFPNSEMANAAITAKTTLQDNAEKEYWQSIVAANTKAAFQRFIQNFPNSKYVPTARQKMASIDQLISETRRYREAIAVGTSKVLEQFVVDYPTSRYLKEIKAKISQLASIPASTDDSSEEVTSEVIPKSITTEKEVANVLGQPKNEVVTPIESEPDTSEINAVVKADEQAPVSVDAPKDVEMPALIAAMESDMVSLPAAEYRLGCDDASCDADARPSVVVPVSAIKVSKHEVTQRQWTDIMGHNPSYFDDCDLCPVESVTYGEVQEFISRLNALPGNPHKYRLPTEAEWEHAASAGSSTEYSGANEPDVVAIYRSNSLRAPERVGSKKSNRLVLFDMSGNVAEWCASWYNKSGYGANGENSLRVVRGGSWNSKASHCRVKHRGKSPPDESSPTIGFRLVRNI